MSEFYLQSSFDFVQYFAFCPHTSFQLLPKVVTIHHTCRFSSRRVSLCGRALHCRVMGGHTYLIAKSTTKRGEETGRGEWELVTPSRPSLLSFKRASATVISSSMSTGKHGFTAPREGEKVGDEAGNGFGVRDCFILLFELLAAHSNQQDSGGIPIGRRTVKTNEGIYYL